MAGIAYALRKLAEKDNLLNLAFALTYSVFISSGSWLFTTLAVGIILVFGPSLIPFSILREFQTVIVYNFSLSFVFAGLFSFVICRDVSDKIYSRQYEKLSGVFIGSLCLLYLIAIPVIVFLYVFVAIFDFKIVFAASINFLLLVGIWHISIFLTTLKEYKTISFSFLFGMILSIITSLFMGSEGFGTAGLLNGFNVGLVLITGILLTLIVYEYPPVILEPFGFLKSYIKYWELALGGLICNIGIWIDKWMMWFSPDSIKYPSNLVLDLNYSNAMFLAYLTIIPGLAYFLYSIEFLFDKEILKFYNSINKKASLSQIIDMKDEVIKCLYNSMIGYFFVQGVFTITALVMAVQILNFLNVPMVQLCIFKFGLLGAFYQFFFVFFVNILFYIDQRKSILGIYLLFLVLNSSLTYASIQLGFRFYGIGFFLAALITFFISAIVVIVKIRRLDYHAFITNNY